MIIKRIWNLLFPKVIKENIIDKYHKQIYDKVIFELKTNPENFSAAWFNKNQLDKSIKSINGSILIMIETGQIVKPISINMTINELFTVRQLIKDIVEKDMKMVINKITSK